ncbi:MAG TPA: sugar transferase [Chitinophagaceae bacterium]|nr:sugar transferase [Chitinophagaceae bacterium]
MPLYNKLTKPFFDIAIGSVAFICLLPVFILTAIILSIANAGTPFFLQRRPGKYEKVFWLIKFKTMKDLRDEKGQLLEDGKRITKVGGFVRKYSLDEIPQLINVIKGDMSLVGPRPLLIEYLPLYTDEQKRRHNIKPGITGWAQVNGRNMLTWDEKFALDTWYVDNQSFLLDMKIIWLTISRVLKPRGINQAGHATMPLFTGSKK